MDESETIDLVSSDSDVSDSEVYFDYGCFINRKMYNKQIQSVLIFLF